MPALCEILLAATIALRFESALIALAISFTVVFRSELKGIEPEERSTPLIEI
jgi:hypothetical protein